MNRLFAATAIATFCAVGASAQSTSQAAQAQEIKEKEKVVTVTGCLRAGEEPSTFVLSSVKWHDKTPAGTSTTGTAGTAGASDKGTTGATLRLVGSPSGVRLSEHVGHMVEITGVIIDEVLPRPSASMPDPVTTGTGGDQTSRTPQPPPTPKSEHTLNVRTVKMIGENCTGR